MPKTLQSGSPEANGGRATADGRSLIPSVAPQGARPKGLLAHEVRRKSRTGCWLVSSHLSRDQQFAQIGHLLFRLTSASNRIHQASCFNK